MAVTFDIQIRADRDYFLPISVVTGQANPASLLGFVINMTIKKSINDDDAHALFKSKPYSANLAFGKFTFLVPRTTNAGWWVGAPSGSGAISTTMCYDISCQDAGTAPSWSTLMEGAVSVIGPVTRVIS